MGSRRSTNMTALQQSLVEVIQKVEASLQTCIDEHVENYNADQGLDYLHTRNSVLLSYLIDLTYYLRDNLLQHGNNNNTDDNSRATLMNRLVEMRTVLDKMRSLDKKLRYQIDKLLAYQTTPSSATFAVAVNEEDPLQFRPQAASENDDDESSDSDDENQVGNDADEASSADEDDIDSDLATARMTLLNAKEKKKDKDEDETTDDNNVYRAPRLAAVPYTNDVADKAAAREKRWARKLRASEVAQTLRQQYSQTPETDDVAGGTELGRQQHAARQFLQRQSDRTKFEEDNMLRLPTTRAERKARKRLMVTESSNLNAIAGGNLVGNLADDVRAAEKSTTITTHATMTFDNDPGRRHATGKRRRTADDMDRDGRLTSNSSAPKKSSSSSKTQNSLQAALYGGAEKKKKKKKTKR